MISLYIQIHRNNENEQPELTDISFTRSPLYHPLFSKPPSITTATHRFTPSIKTTTNLHHHQDNSVNFVFLICPLYILAMH